jgi:hypothetical protein
METYLIGDRSGDGEADGNNRKESVKLHCDWEYLWKRFRRVVCDDGRRFKRVTKIEYVIVAEARRE